MRYLVVHERLFDDQLVWTAMLSAIREQRDQVEQVRTFGAATVIQLRPASQVPTVTDLREIPRTAFQASASRLEDRLELAFDGDVDTRWDSGEPQSGDEWLELRFDRPYTVTRVRLDLADDILSDYPRRLRIDSSTDGEHFETVYEDDILPQVVVGVTRRARPVPIDIESPTHNDHRVATAAAAEDGAVVLVRQRADSLAAVAHGPGAGRTTESRLAVMLGQRRR